MRVFLSHSRQLRYKRTTCFVTTERRRVRHTVAGVDVSLTHMLLLLHFCDFVIDCSLIAGEASSRQVDEHVSVGLPREHVVLFLVGTQVSGFCEVPVVRTDSFFATRTARIVISRRRAKRTLFRSATRLKRLARCTCDIFVEDASVDESR